MHAPKEEVLNVRDATELAVGLYQDEHYEEAERLFRAVATLDPSNFTAINGIGLCLAQDGRDYEESLQWFDQAFSLIRNEMVALSSNRARALGELGRAEEALSLLNKLLGSVNEFPIANYNRGLILLQLHRHAEALADLDVALSYNPEDALARFARAYCYLTLGRYQEGFRDYEYRVKEGKVETGALLWTGDQCLEGKTILVHAEQGLGDNIMFMRYIPLLVKKAKHVVVVASDNVRPLAEGIPGVEVVGGDQNKWPPIDFWVRFMSLAYCFRTTPETIPPPVVLTYQPEKLARWQTILGKKKGLRVGICWTGGIKSKYDAFRSIPLEALAPLISTPGVEFISLQKDVREADLKVFQQLTKAGLLKDVEFEIKDFGETAHLMKQLDLVITVDTSVAHLAGTVGVPTWVLLTSYRTYWLWVDPSPWYLSIKLFRQVTDKVWGPVIQRVVQELSGLLAEKAA